LSRLPAAGRRRRRFFDAGVRPVVRARPPGLFLPGESGRISQGNFLQVIEK
jgi:hypothetical protein